MDRFTSVLAGLLGRVAGLLPARRRDWAEAVLAEAGEIPAWTGRLAWLGGGLWLVAREVLMRVIGVLALAAGAAGLVAVGWPGSSSDSAVPLNRVYIVVTVAALAVLPVVVGRCAGPARAGWAPRAARAGGYALVLALIAAKAVKDRAGSRLGAYFAVVPGIWAIEILLLLVIAAYVAGLLILTSRRVRLTRWILPAGTGLGAATAGVLYALAPAGVNIDLKWWGLAGLALPLATGFLAARMSARDPRRAALGPVGQGCLAAACAMAAAALLLAVLTSVTVALFPQRVPLQMPGPAPGGGCETCDPNQVVIPPGLRREYCADLSVGQADMAPLAALMIAPLFGAWIGVLGAALARTSPGTRQPGARGPHAVSPPPRPGRLMASAAEREELVDVLKAAFALGRLTRQGLEARVGQTLVARTGADLAALTADLPAGPPATEPVPQPGPAPPRQPAGRAVTWSACGLLTLALLAAAVAVPSPSNADHSPVALVLFFVAVVYFMAWLVAGAQLLDTWRRQRSRPAGGRDPVEPGSPAAGRQ
ncbi:MAG TPA: DUF1707 domain-containing protein [Streptosporangiaceae bacterium]